MELHQLFTVLLGILIVVIGYVARKTYELTTQNRENTIRHHGRIKSIEDWKETSSKADQGMTKNIAEIKERLIHIETLLQKK